VPQNKRQNDTPKTTVTNWHLFETGFRIHPFAVAKGDLRDLFKGPAGALTVTFVILFALLTATAAASVPARIEQLRVKQIVSVLNRIPEDVKPEPPKPKFRFKTGDLPKGRAVPLQKFVVGARYGNRGPHTGGVHGGLDFPARQGEPVHTIAGGKVVVAGWQGAAGLSVTVRTHNGDYNLYGHLSSLNARKGQYLHAGDRLGKVGSTGNSTGPHLHFQVEKANGSGTTDPLPWLKVSAGHLNRLGRR